jgi:hypothetical protein
MTLLSVVKDVCAAVGVAIPTAVVNNQTDRRTMTEMLALANEMAQRIAYDNRDWTKLRVTQTYMGDGLQTAFPLPANFKRLMLTSNVWRSTSTQQPMRFITDTDAWMQRRARNATDSAWGEWTILGGDMHIFPVMPAGTGAYFAYLDKNCIDLASGGRGDFFQSDLDGFTLDERVLKLGMIWQWKSQKGTPYAEDMGTYGDALSVAMGHDSPAPIILTRGLRSGGFRGSI